MDPNEMLLPSVLRRRLKTRLLGRRVYYYPEVDSTNRVAVDLARCGEPEGTLVLTDYQTKGRGRADHTWSSPPGKDLLFSLVLRPDGEPGFVLLSTLAFSVAVAEALTETFGFYAGVKWPNDIYTREGKIGGILAERVVAAGGKAFVVVGIGLNVNSVKNDFPPAFRDRAVSCRVLAGRTVDRPALMGTVLAALETCYDTFRDRGFAAFKPAYERLLVINGWRVWFDRSGRRLAGTVEGVQDDGALLVRLGGGDEPLALYNETVSVE